MKIFGHPIHIILIHFPSALFPIDLMCSFAAYFSGNVAFLCTSVITLFGGTLFGWLAVATGTFDLLAVLKNKPKSIKKALIHGGINTTVLVGYTALSFMAYKKQPEFIQDGLGILIFKTVLVGVLIVGNFIGGSLVLKDKVLDEN